MTPLVKIETEAVRKIWPMVRDRLVEMAALPRMRAAWCAEDVYLELMLGRTHLWITPDAAGFVVLQVVREPYQSDLHVWIANNIAFDRADTFMPQLLDIAAENACDRVTWSSTRREWRRLFPEAEIEYQFAIRVGGSDGQ